MPFGEEILSVGGRSSTDNYDTDEVRQGFTGYIKDDETGLEFAKARMYAKNYGRFSSIDPMGFKKPLLENPQNLNRYVYTRNSPLTYVDSNGKCSVPAGLQKGQVGICIEAFIKTSKVPGSSFGLGNGRGFDGNNPELTSKIEVKLIASASKDGVNISFITKPGRSELAIPIGGGDSPVVGAVKVGFEGSGTANVNYDYRRPAGSEDFGTTNVNVQGTGQNAFSATAEALQHAPGIFTSTAAKGVVAASEAGYGPPAGTIEFNMNFKITGSGQVEWAGGQSKGYPSYAAYSYTKNEDGSVTVQELRRRDESELEDLKKPMTPIP